MHFTWADWAVVLAYFVLSSVVGLAFGRRAGKSPEEYFTAGRALPWWLAGTSMVATTFAADTPLAVTGLVAAHGLSGNWVWWNLVAGNVLTVFFFARLWRRAGVQTDAELAELRYAGRPAAALRVFRALYLAIPVNLIILGWVNLAMVKVLEATLGVRPVEAMLGLFVMTVAYSVVSGLWGVVTTDFFQFLLAMVGSIVLAVVAVDAVGGLDALLARAPERWGSADAALAIFPSDASWMPLTAFLTFLAVQWWATWYPGSEPGGGGYVAQRIFASKTERDGQLATLWFTIAHYAVRPWPWILTALAMLANTAITTVGWVAVTLVTKPEPDATLQTFVRRVQPGGPGWRAVTQAAGLRERPIADGLRSLVAWACGVVAVYAALFGWGRCSWGHGCSARDSWRWRRSPSAWCC